MDNEYKWNNAYMIVWILVNFIIMVYKFLTRVITWLINTNISFWVEAPFSILADFESIFKPVNQPSVEHSIKKDENVACSYSYLITSRVPGVKFEPHLYVSPDAAEHFLLSLQNNLNNNIMPSSNAM